MISAIEDGIIHTLKNASALGYLKSIDSYGGQLDEDLSEVIRAFPAVWVVFAGSGKPTKLGVDKWKVPATFAIMVGARNVRNEAATRKGDAVEVGTYQMLQHVSTLLLNNDLGLPIERIQPGAVRTLYNTKVRGQALSVFSQEWTTAYVTKAPTLDEQELLKIGLNYYLKPGDDVADAQDELTFNTGT